MRSRQRERRRSGGRHGGRVVSPRSPCCRRSSWRLAPRRRLPRTTIRSRPPIAGSGPCSSRCCAAISSMAGNSNLLSAGGWRQGAVTGPTSTATGRELCIIRRHRFPRACADNSSSARLDIPDGARSSPPGCTCRRRCRRRRPAARPARRPRPPASTTPSSARRRWRPEALEGRGGGDGAVDAPGRVGRHRVRRCSAAPARTPSPTSCPSGPAPYLPYASWAIVAAYELDPARRPGRRAPPAEEQQRFARRAVSWHDGFVYLTEGRSRCPSAGSRSRPGAGLRQELPHRRPRPAPRRRQPAVQRQAARQQRDARRLRRRRAG